MHSVVQQARKMKTVKIVSFDWLEDSLMAKSAKREGEYLMGARAKTAKETKEKKKAVRKENIDNDSKHIFTHVMKLALSSFSQSFRKELRRI